MSAPIAWALICAFCLGVFFGGLLAATLIIAVRIKIIAVSEKRKTNEAIRARYQFGPAERKWGA